MSTIQANAILDASGGNTVTINGVTPNSEVLKGRNLIINGAMQVAQRSTSTTTNSGTNSYKTIDRYTTYNSALGGWTQSQDTDAPNGFGYSLKMLCDTADASPAASDRILIQTKLEGQDIQSLGFGDTSNTYTVSFYVKSNVTGTYILEQYGDTASATGNNISKSYTIDAADTWERKTITLNVDSGAMTADNTSGLVIAFWLASGSNYTSGTLNTSWSSPANADRAVGQVNLGSAASNYWQITGLKLEVGSVATAYDHRSYGEELALCQRYYYAFINSGSGNEAWITTATSYNSANAYGGVRFPVTMRTIPSLNQYTGTDVWQYYNNNQSDRFDSFTIFGANQSTTSAAMIYNADTMAITAGQSGNFQGGNASCYMHFDAEL